MHEKVDKDDFLLTQIDEFRKKAQKLQEMLDTKETKAKGISKEDGVSRLICEG